MKTAVGFAPFDLPGLCTYFSERSPQPASAVEGLTHIVRYANDAFVHLSGKQHDELIGRPFVEAVPDGEMNGCIALLDRVLSSGTPEKLIELEHSQNRHTPIYWTYVVWAIMGPENIPIGVMVQVTDSTEIATFRKQSVAMNEALILSAVRQHELIDTIERGEQARHELEVQMFQAQKMESLGVLAGGIAHDLNNMLTPVLGFAELSIDSLPRDSPIAPMLESVMTNARRAAELVQQILAYAGKGLFLVQPVDLSNLVLDMQGLLSAGVSPNTKLTFELGDSLPAVEADPTQLRQIVMNLVKNASESLGEESGYVTIRTGLVTPNAFAVTSEDDSASPAVFLEVSDTGCGMSAEVIEKMFDPFYTTKFTGRGLGLAVVQGIVRRLKAALHVRSKPGMGSTFRLVLQSSKKPAIIQTQLAQLVLWRGTGTILIIDDEKGIVQSMTLILEKAGLTVLAANGAEDGLTIFRERAQEIDAAILDLTMPVMSGLEMAQLLRGIRRDLPIVLMSGFSVEEVHVRAAGLGITAFVQKPFTIPALLTAVQKALLKVK